MEDAPDLWLFSYGTLRWSAVQLALFGRRLAEEPDTLSGFRLDTIEIDDPGVVDPSGRTTHLILRSAPESGPPIEGAALAVTQAELAVADDYEGANYVRIAATLGSGRRAYVYVAPGADRR